MPKRAIRQETADRRNALDLSERTARSRRIVEHLTRLADFARARVVMFYVTLGSEVQTEAAIQWAAQAGKRVFVPDAVGALEITSGLVRRADPKEIDLVVVPGIAFDRAGNRIGYGSGWYDRFSKRLRPDAALVGLAYSLQVVEAVPNHPHDIRVHKIVTEEEVIACTPAQRSRGAEEQRPNTD